MKVDKKQLEKSQVELKIEASVDELKLYSDQAAQQISKNIKIHGFRPGKAPKSMVEKQVGKAELWEETVRIALPKLYTKALIENKVEAIGQPEVKLEKVAPENPLIFIAKITVLPEIELPDFKKIKVKKKKIEVDEKKVEEAIKDLQKHRAKLVKVDREAKRGDAVEVNFKTFLDKIPIDQGESKNHPVTIGDGYFVPGFEDNLIGMKAGDKKDFTIKFPDKYLKKELAGKDVEFSVEMNSVQKRELPELNDEFAKGLGGRFKDFNDLKNKISENLKLEAEEKEKQRQEMEIMTKIAEQTKMDMPDLLVDVETNKMLGELKDSVLSQGGDFDKYLESLKKTEDDLRKEFKERAEKRAKFGLILRHIAKVENIAATEKEIEEEINHTLEHYQHDKAMMEKIQSNEYKEYAQGLIVNRKTFELLKKKCTV